LRNKVVVITGASSGIGLALALQALEEGAFVAVCARNCTSLIEANSKEIEEGRFLVMSVDVSDEIACKQFIDAVISKWQKIDILINNAGISMRSLLAETEISVLKELMNINFWGTVYCTKYALESIKAQKGVIVGVSSIAGYRGLPGRTGYSASKFAMQGFLESLRTELLHSGAHVMWVSPGFTASNIRNVSRMGNGSVQGETPLEESKLMSASTCASLIYKAIHKRKRVLIIGMLGMFTVWLNKLLPSVADKLVYNHFKKEPGSPLK
jgi:short-subunit dehydrogenase